MTATPKPDPGASFTREEGVVSRSQARVAPGRVLKRVAVLGTADRDHADLPR